MSETEADQPTPTPSPPPDQEGLTQDQFKQAVAWLDAHWTKRECPMHGPTQWSLDSQMGAVPVQTPHGTNLGSVFPLLVLTCANCGYTVFVNALAAGITGQVLKPAPETAPSQEGGQ
jgi:hypothetical protein